jgi:hypothetical protein
MACRANARFEDITFSNLVMHDVTGPISIGLDSTSRRPRDDGRPHVPGVVRNIAFNGIRATVVDTGRQYPDMAFHQEYRPGETRTCITVNGVGEDFLENISFTDVHVHYAGGGTAEEAARAVPAIAGEYFEIGTPPAYGVYARNVRGLTLDNVRVTVAQPDARPAVVLDRVSDAAIHGLSAQGSKDASAVLRLVATRDVLLTGTRVLTPAAVCLRVEGAASEGITLDGGDIRKVTTPVAFAEGAPEGAARVRG